MFKTIEGATNCEIRSVIRFLNARNVIPSEIHQQICHVYGANATSDGMVRKWVRLFNKGRENVHDEARSGFPSLVNDDLVRKVNERVCDDRRFTISDLSLQFPQISRTLLYDIVSSHLGRRRPHSMRRVYRNLCLVIISASIMGANMWKNSLHNVESDNNKILYEILLQWNGTYFLNKPRICDIKRTSENRQWTMSNGVPHTLISNLFEVISENWGSTQLSIIIYTVETKERIKPYTFLITCSCLKTCHDI